MNHYWGIRAHGVRGPWARGLGERSEEDYNIQVLNFAQLTVLPTVLYCTVLQCRMCTTVGVMNHYWGPAGHAVQVPQAPGTGRNRRRNYSITG